MHPLLEAALRRLAMTATRAGVAAVSAVAEVAVDASEELADEVAAKARDLGDHLRKRRVRRK